jgi:hypothetical protein
MGSGIFISPVLTRSGLCISGSLVNGSHHGTCLGIRLGAGMNGFGSKFHEVKQFFSNVKIAARPLPFPSAF